MAPKKKPARGRPPKPVDELHDQAIYVRVTADEKATIERAVGNANVTSWARDILNRAAKRQLGKSR